VGFFILVMSPKPQDTVNLLPPKAGEGISGSSLGFDLDLIEISLTEGGILKWFLLDCRSL